MRSINRKRQQQGSSFISLVDLPRSASHPSSTNLIRLDLPWRPNDATVNVPGYDLRILPGSSVSQTLALYAMPSEMPEAMRKPLQARFSTCVASRADWPA